MSLVGACSKCSKVTTVSFCSNCRDAIYCSPICQKQDWATHKKLCSQIKTQNRVKEYIINNIFINNKIIELMRAIPNRSDAYIKIIFILNECFTKGEYPIVIMGLDYLNRDQLDAEALKYNKGKSQGSESKEKFYYLIYTYDFTDKSKKRLEWKGGIVLFLQTDNPVKRDNKFDIDITNKIYFSSYPNLLSVIDTSEEIKLILRKRYTETQPFDFDISLLLSEEIMSISRSPNKLLTKRALICHGCKKSGVVYSCICKEFLYCTRDCREKHLRETKHVCEEHIIAINEVNMCCNTYFSNIEAICKRFEVFANYSKELRRIDALNDGRVFHMVISFIGYPWSEDNKAHLFLSSSISDRKQLCQKRIYQIDNLLNKTMALVCINIYCCSNDGILLLMKTNVLPIIWNTKESMTADRINAIIVYLDNQHNRNEIGTAIDIDLIENTYMDNKKGGLVRVKKMEFMEGIKQGKDVVLNYDHTKIEELPNDPRVTIATTDKMDSLIGKISEEDKSKIKKQVYIEKKNNKITFGNVGIHEDE